LNFVLFSVLGGSEGEQDEVSDVIITKKKPSKKAKSVSRGKRSKKAKRLSNKKEPSKERPEPDEVKEEPDEEKEDYAERLSEDREGSPQGAQNDEEENSSKERAADESKGASRENVNEEESGSEGNQNESDGESSPSKEVKESLEDLPSPDGTKLSELPDDEPLVNNLATAPAEATPIFCLLFLDKNLVHFLILSVTYDNG
jgi:sister-chromatid-cohesion protein PDS5